MGQFKTCEEIDDYEVRYCNCCVHFPGDDEEGCPIIKAHIESQIDGSRSSIDAKEILDQLIPTNEDRTHNRKCAMFLCSPEAGNVSIDKNL
ncbi:MAG: hypothetical protein WC451_03260 [Patescibacteria group bacterium]|jgi:hypothetical protein